MGRSRRWFLCQAAVVPALAGCADEDGEEPGLHAVDVLTLYRDGDGWYDYPGEVGVQVTVENTDVDRHAGTLVVALRRSSGSDTWTRRRDIELPGGTTRSYRVVFSIPTPHEGPYSAEARIEG